jgi:hypothetical protein
MRAVSLAGFGVLLCLGPIYADEVSPPISPDTYRSLSCKQILQEARAVALIGSTLLGSKLKPAGTITRAPKQRLLSIGRVRRRRPLP